MEIHRQWDMDFLEAVYQEAAVIEFPIKNIFFERELSLPIIYKDVVLPTPYRADFICFLKSLLSLRPIGLSTTEESQLLNYLEATGLQRGFLINFGAPSLQYKRLV